MFRASPSKNVSVFFLVGSFFWSAVFGGAGVGADSRPASLPASRPASHPVPRLEPLPPPQAPPQTPAPVPPRVLPQVPPQAPQPEVFPPPSREDAGSFQSLFDAKQKAPILAPVATKGVLDLRKWPLHKWPASLQGEWGFFWHRLLPHDAITKPTLFAKEAPLFVKEPSSWRGFHLDGKKLPSAGYATYFLRILYTPENQLRYAFHIHLVYSAYRMWINGKLVAEVGRVATTDAEASAHQRPLFYELPPHTKHIDLVLHVSNFSHREGGLRHPILFGEEISVRKQISFPLELEIFLMGILLIFGFYHLVCFFLFPKERALLWLALFCLVLSVRVIFAGRLVLGSFFPSFPFEALFKIEYLTFFAGFSICLALIRSIFPEETLVWLQTPLEWSGWSLSLLAVFTPVSVFSFFLFPFQVIVFFGILYCLFLFVRSVSKKRTGARILIGGLAIISLFVLHDMWYHVTINQSSAKPGPFSEFTPFGVLALALSFSIALFWRAVQAFHAVEVGRESLVKLNEAYGRFVPHNFLLLLEKQSILDVRLGDHVQREMTIMFSDIRAFTSLSESITPQENFHFLNDYLQGMEDVIDQSQGMIDKYIGDGIMALFPKGAESAIHAGLAMLRTLDVFNHQRILRDQAPIQIGIGLNTGTLMLGTIGGERRMDGTVISDAVNLASRIEGMTKLYATPFLLTEATWKAAADTSAFFARPVDRVAVKGKKQSILIYEVFNADPVERFEQKKACLETYLQALAAYQAQSFQEAEDLFLACVQKAPQDTVSLLYLERCQHLKKNPPPPGWDGVYHATHK